MAQSTLPFVSVIVPVFNDAQRLRHCLAALDQQTYPEQCYEVIVVDNASTEDVSSVVHSYRRAIAAYEATPGSYAARNTGIALARGEVIAFTDADCIPAPDWIEKGVAHVLRVPNCGLVAGKIQIFFKDPQHLTAVELYEQVMALPQRQFLEQQGYGATANLFTLKTVISTVGLFDARLKSSGDRDWGQRVGAMGYRQVYADDTCVAHPARYSFSQLYRRTVRYAGGHYDLQDKLTRSPWQLNLVFFKSVAQDLMPPLIFTVHTFRNEQLKGVDQKLKVAMVMFFVRYVSAWEKLRLKLGGVSARE
ncbi:glycosyltransferase family 2 protein [Oculatella sp. LEGE 06141]|uniref:glycosyltransferase n=1 Tax=Oculatella sp. LEGE 06141 TaxID=1828648 RepID=UPI0018827033|nr:glycosyltransferase family 2 protein [Oculatella sp. LEGE 06141]MBE9178311.1 glycosyltransferase family 2 protein [Oculatella sp. LEGE 06141]